MSSHKAIFMDIIEEPLDVKHQGTALEPAPMCNMDIVHEGEAGIKGAREGTCPELRCGNKAISINVKQHVLGDGLFQEFGEALKEGDRAVVFSHCIIISPRLQDNHDQGTTPLSRVVAHKETHIGKDGNVIFHTLPSLLQYAPRLL